MAAATSPAGFAGAPRVNLMPRGEIQRRDRSALARRWTLAIVATLAVVVAASAGAFAMQIAAATRLAVENARTTAVLGELAAMSQVRDALALENELATFRTSAMATDVSWLPLLNSIAPAIPQEARIVGFSLAPGGIPQGDDPTAEIGVTSTLMIDSPAVADVAPLVRAIRPMAGVIEVDAWSTVLETGDYRHEIRIVLDQTLYTGDYAEEVAE